MVNLTPKQVLSIVAYSRYFKDTYKSEVVEIRSDGILIKTPIHNGGLVLMGVGTKVKITAHRIGQGEEFDAELLERLDNDNLMLITRPDQISRAGRQGEPVGAKVIAVTSGKGGVGKSTLTINLALALIREGFRVAVIDADLGTANLDIMLGLEVKSDLTELISGEKEITQIIIKGPEDLIVVPGGSGLQELTELSEWQFSRLIKSFNYLDDICDYLIIDTGAGLSKNVTNFLLAADEVVVVTTPEPHCITDGYAIIKVISEVKEKKYPLRLIVNKAETYSEGDQVGEKMVKVARKFLELEIDYLGALLDDKNVVRSNKKRVPLLLSDPISKTARDIQKIVQGMVQPSKNLEKPQGVAGFIQRFKGLFGKS